MTGAHGIIYPKLGLLAGPSGPIYSTDQKAVPFLWEMVTRVSHRGGKCRQHFCFHLSPRPLLKPHKLSSAALTVGQDSQGWRVTASQWNDCHPCLAFP